MGNEKCLLHYFPRLFSIQFTNYRRLVIRGVDIKTIKIKMKEILPLSKTMELEYLEDDPLVLFSSK